MISAWIMAVVHHDFVELLVKEDTGRSVDAFCTYLYLFYF